MSRVDQKGVAASARETRTEPETRLLRAPEVHIGDAAVSAQGTRQRIENPRLGIAKRHIPKLLRAPDGVVLVRGGKKAATRAG